MRVSRISPYRVTLCLARGILLRSWRACFGERDSTAQTKRLSSPSPSVSTFNDSLYKVWKQTPANPKRKEKVANPIPAPNGERAFNSPPYHKGRDESQEPEVHKGDLPSVEGKKLVDKVTSARVVGGEWIIGCVCNSLAISGKERYERKHEPLRRDERTIWPIVSFAVPHRSNSVKSEAHSESLDHIIVQDNVRGRITILLHLPSTCQRTRELGDSEPERVVRAK